MRCFTRLVTMAKVIATFTYETALVKHGTMPWLIRQAESVGFANNPTLNIVVEGEVITRKQVKVL